MKVPLYHLDAFTTRAFGGNPAAVCPLAEWLDDTTLQSIAAENNLSETAFFVGSAGHYHLRWFTPTVEVDLCGHATLASAHVIFQRLEPGRTEARFDSKSGPLTVTGEGSRLWLDFPSRPPQPCPAPPEVDRGLGGFPREVLASRDYLMVFDTEAQVRALEPDFVVLGGWDRAVIVTSPGLSCDFVSRFFAPTMGIDEDPVTGSAHCTLIPFWAERLGRAKLSARQVSARGGELSCELAGERVRIGGAVTPYLEGTIEI